MTKEECKNKIARNNNFDSFEKAIRYSFNRALLQSEKDFIDKIIDEAMELYAQQVNKNDLCPDVMFSLLDKETVSEPIQNALYTTGNLTIDQCNNITEGILQYIKEAGFEIVKSNET